MGDTAKGKGQPESEGKSKGKRGRRGRPSPASAKTVRTIALAGLGVIAVVVGLMLILDDSDSPSTSGAARIVTVEELQETAASGEAPIYWAGAQDEAELELSQPDAARTYVRYLTEGAEAGDP